MTTKTGTERDVAEYRHLMMSAFADFSTLDETELQVARGGGRELLRVGRPLAPAELAGALGLPIERVDEILRRHAEMGFVYFNGEDRVQAMWAVGGIDAGHRITVDGQTGPTWCALDTLLLPIWWGAEAAVTSRDPLTGRGISLTVGPDGVTDLVPANAVVSAYEPEGPVTQDVRASFCEFVNFFESAETAAEWARPLRG
ncbi:MAG: organomercurial lyase, partial [Chloroflexota bacterium]